MDSNTWAQIERDRWKKRKGWKGVKRNVVEAQRQGGGGQFYLSSDLLEEGL